MYYEPGIAEDDPLVELLGENSNYKEVALKK